MGTANVSSSCSSRGSCCTAHPRAAAAVGHRPTLVLLLLGPRGTLRTMVLQGGGIAPLRACTERRHGSSAVPRTRLAGGTWLWPRGPSARGPRGGFCPGQAGGSAWSHRLQRSDPGSPAMWVATMEMPVASGGVWWPPPAHCHRVTLLPSVLPITWSHSPVHVKHLVGMQESNLCTI